MGQLIKFSTTPFEAVRFTQNARLVPSNMVDIERRKALARHNAFQARSSSVVSHSADLDYVNRVNRAFSAKHHAATTTPAIKSSAPQPSVPHASHQSVSSVPVQSSAESMPSLASEASVQTPEVFSGIPVQSSADAQTQAAYNTERGAFELRVAKGELSYVPAMVMTIVTQYPEVNFEYIGGFNYVPPDWNEPLGTNMNITV